MRWRRIAKWGCTIATVLAIAALVANRWYVVDVFDFAPGVAGPKYGDVLVRRELWVSGGHAQAHFFSPPKWYSGPHRGTVNLYRSNSPRWAWFFASFTRNGETCVCFPLYPPVLLLVVSAGVLWLADVRRSRNVSAGGCLRCGYDRRGLAADAKCPECGTVPTLPAPAP